MTSIKQIKQQKLFVKNGYCAVSFAIIIHKFIQSL